MELKMLASVASFTVCVASLPAMARPEVHTAATTPAPASTKDAINHAVNHQPAQRPESDGSKITLKVGEKAPALAVDAWVKGEAVTGFEKGRVYVVEFWATWCPACRESIGHVTELQSANKDVVFMGIAASERTIAGSDRLAVLTEFVTSKGSALDYRVGYDAKGAMVKSWMLPSGNTRIPCAFVVDGAGKIAWIGHPNDPNNDLGAALRSITEGPKKAEASGAKRNESKVAKKPTKAAKPKKK